MRLVVMFDRDTLSVISFMFGKHARGKTASDVSLG